MYYYISYTLFMPKIHIIPLKQLSTADVAFVAKDCFSMIRDFMVPITDINILYSIRIVVYRSIVTSPQLICDVTPTWGTGNVTSYYWRNGNFH